MFKIVIKRTPKPWRRMMHYPAPRREPDKWKLTMGLGVAAWTAEGIIEYLEGIPRDAILAHTKVRQQFNEITLIFEENIGQKRIPNELL